jgi:hypothetical protein
MNPSICQACGERIENPDGRHVCEKCDTPENFLDSRLLQVWFWGFVGCVGAIMMWLGLKTMGIL